MGIILGNSAMVVSMWIVLGLIGLNALVQLLSSLRSSVNLSDLAQTFTRPMLFDILPLLILAALTKLPSFHIVMMIWFFVAAVLIAIRTLLDLGQSLKLSK